MEASREFSRTPRRLPPCSDVSVLQKTRMSHFWDTHHTMLGQWNFNMAVQRLVVRGVRAGMLLTSKKWRLQREGRRSRRHSIEMKSDWLFDKPRSNYWLGVTASNRASHSTGVTQSHCNPQ